MAMHGTLTQFDSSQEDWSAYVERLAHYFVANDVKDAGKKRSILLAACGPTTYKLIRSLLAADEIKGISYADLVAKVKNHLEPKPSPIVQRYKFNSRVRTKGESVATYLAALRELSEYCEYGAALPEMLRDRLVCGVNHEGIQRRLLAEKDLTYDRAREIAQAVEAAERGTRDLKQASNPTGDSPVVKSCLYASAEKKGKGTREGKPVTDSKLLCYRCGASSHLAPACKFKEAVCHSCKKKGHLARVCRSKAGKGEGPKDSSKSRGTYYMAASGDRDPYNLFTIRTVDGSCKEYLESESVCNAGILSIYLTHNTSVTHNTCIKW